MAKTKDVMDRDMGGLSISYDLKEAVGKKIVAVRQMSDDDMAYWGWYRKPSILQLDDGSLLLAQTDEEGNDGGCIVRMF